MFVAKMTPNHRTAFWVVVVYLTVTAVYALCASTELWTAHTRYNHFAWLADAFLHSRLHLSGPPPVYAGGNDFARFEDHWFIVFPPFPAILLMPVVAIVGNVDKVYDGAFFLLLAGIAPVGLLLALERLRRLRLVVLSEYSVVALVLLFAFGSVYFFTAVQGTVWFAAHVVTAAAMSLYLAAAIGAKYPIWAGLALSAIIGTRTHLGGAGVFFVMEALRISRRKDIKGIRAFDWSLVARRIAPVLVLSALAYVALLWYNWARFHDVFDVGYRFLQITWRPRIERWGMFNYHYLARNLGILLTSLPYLGTQAAAVPFQVNAHGLALWFTSSPLSMAVVAQTDDQDSLGTLRNAIRDCHPVAILSKQWLAAIRSTFF